MLQNVITNVAQLAHEQRAHLVRFRIKIDNFLPLSNPYPENDPTHFFPSPGILLSLEALINCM